MTISIGEKSFLVISIPIEHNAAPPCKEFVRGRYVSIEGIAEENGEVIWKMATASNAGGKVPKFVTELAMPSKTAEDVPSYMDWCSKQ